MHKKYEFDGSHAINRLLSFEFRFFYTRFPHDFLSLSLCRQKGKSGIKWKMTLRIMIERYSNFK